MISHLLLIFSAFLLPFAFLIDDSPPRKQKNRIKYTRNHQDVQEIIDKLREKFTEALGPEHPLTLPWNQVEIVSGWPSSVYLLEPNYWCKHDIEVLKEAIDSVEIRPLTRKPKMTRPADELHSQLMTECERLNLVKEKSSVIDWRRIAANVDGFRLTNTYYRKWNAQDRLMVQRVLDSLKQVADASLFIEHRPISKYPESKTRDDMNDNCKKVKTSKKRKTESLEEESDKLTKEAEDDRETSIHHQENPSSFEYELEAASSSNQHEQIASPETPYMQSSIIYGLPIDFSLELSDVPLEYLFDLP